MLAAPQEEERLNFDDTQGALRTAFSTSRAPSSYRVILAHQHGVADMSEQRSSEWLSIETMRPPSETEVWLYAKIDGAEITKKGRISKTHVCVEHAALYSVDPLRKLLPELVDFDLANSGKPRFTLGLVGVRSGRIRYFDSRDEKIGLDHVLGSSASLSQMVCRFASVATALSRGPFRFEFWGNRQSDAKRAARPSRFGRSSIANT
jgi:hypothetical protein